MMHFLLPTVLLSAMSPDAAPVSPRVTLDTTVAVAPAARSISLDLRSGGFVKITGGDNRFVRVLVTENGKECKDCSVQLEETGDGLQLRSARSASGGEGRDLRFEIEVPNHFNVDLSSAGGEVQIEGVDGEIKGQTASGALVLRRLSGAVDLQTLRGDVTLRESYVSGRVATVGGKVLLEDVMGTVRATSQGGKVTERRVTRE